MHNNWSEHLKVLQRMANKGESLADIARSFNVSRERMRQVFKKYGLQPCLKPKRRALNRPTHYNKKT